MTKITLGTGQVSWEIVFLCVKKPLLDRGR